MCVCVCVMISPCNTDYCGTFTESSSSPGPLFSSAYLQRTESTAVLGWIWLLAPPAHQSGHHCSPLQRQGISKGPYFRCSKQLVHSCGKRQPFHTLAEPYYSGWSWTAVPAIYQEWTKGHTSSNTFMDYLQVRLIFRLIFVSLRSTFRKMYCWEIGATFLEKIHQLQRRANFLASNYGIFCPFLFLGSGSVFVTITAYVV